jgi:hypothetical protein
MTSPQETKALHEIGRRLSEGKSLVLTDEQAGLLMKATPQYRDCSMLAAPQVVVREDEPASLWIGSRIPYTAGYEEPNEPAGAPKPRQATLDSGLKFDTTAHLVGQNGVKLDGLLRMTTLLGFDKKKALEALLAEGGPALGATLGAGAMGGMGKNPLTGAALGYGMGSIPEMILSRKKPAEH